MVINKKNTLMASAVIVTGGFLSVTTLSFIMLSVLRVSALDNAVDDISITVPTSCSLTPTLDSAHTETINIGTNVDDIGTTTIKVFCNDSEGFAIYAAGYTGDVIGGTNSNKLIGTNNQTSIGNIDTGIATSGATSNWSMKLIKVENEQGQEEVAYNPANLTIESDTNGSFANYHVVPNEYTKVASFTSTTDATLGSVLQTTYQAYISPTQAAGTYAGKVIYTLVHPSNTSAPGSKSLDTATTLQDVTYCADTLTVGQAYSLIDTRDNQQYKVARLADGNCWMLDNLALDPTDNTTAQNLNAGNTNATNEAIANYLNGGNSNNITGWSSVAVADVDTNFNSYTAPRINNASKDTLVTSYGPASTNGQAKVGIYYNYCAATVGTYCYEDDQDVELPNTNIDASQDLCPANWRMPTGGLTGEYQALYNKYNTTMDATNVASLQYNLSTPLSGYFYNGSAYSQNEWGVWWSSTRSSDSGVYVPNVVPTDLSSDGNLNREYGSSMRCLVGE